MDPPSVPPPPPPPPPLNIPPSRARLQLAARLALHQKNSAGSSAQSGGTEGNPESDETVPDRESDSILRNPFEDDGEDDVDDESDDGLAEDDNNAESWGAGASRGSWWRGALRRGKEKFGDGRDDSDSDKDEAAGGEDEDEEFGDFAMPEVDKDGSSDKTGVIVKPLPVHPPTQSQKASAFTSLWPFGSKDKEKQKTKDNEAPAENSGDATGEITGDDGEKIKSTHEATRRTSIEDPDDEEVVV
ncbi:hypothetical protein F4774DRAFT_392618 [Daldinia eschscholtzii]|nr:hypothetical protein F4774DRAFT_392618 [Daldinia eschscholtzii]